MSKKSKDIFHIVPKSVTQRKLNFTLLHIIPTRCTCHRVYFYLTLLYMFRALLLPIVRSTKQL